jgi:hypothetical protein
MGGIGKSTLAAQIATRVNRLQPGRVVTVVNREVPASAPWPAEMNFVILDDFDDNLSQESGRAGRGPGRRVPADHSGRAGRQ